MILVALAVAPSAFWLWYFLRRDRLRPEPRFLVRRVFALGALAAVAAVIVQVALFNATGLWEGRASGWNPVIVAALVGLTEEAVKFAAVYFGVYRNAEFNEVMDGIVYMVTASLGFATLENLAYVLWGGFEVAVTRALISVPGHAFFGALMGFYMGVAKFAGPLERRWLFRGFLLAAFAHAAFDSVLFTDTFLGLIVIPLVVFLWWRAIVHSREALVLDNQRFS
jgi:RsiW-degrading membrane proteinase PrsW (M82 family)